MTTRAAIEPWLAAAGCASAAASLLHLAIIAGGPRWYRFFGAGEGMACAAEAGKWQPAAITVAITVAIAPGVRGGGVVRKSHCARAHVRKRSARRARCATLAIRRSAAHPRI